MDQLGGHNIFQSPWTIGGQDAFWLSFYDFGKKIGVKYSNYRHFEAYKDYAKNCGWMFAYKGLAFVSERPAEIHFNDEGLLHNESGKSVLFSDGWGVSSWRGIRIPDEWVTSSPPTAKDALHCENVEQRRAACEILGWHNILKELNAKSIDRHENPLVGELLEVNIPEIGRERFLRVMCGTAREFALPVPPETETALSAQAWLNWTTEDNCIPQVRT